MGDVIQLEHRKSTTLKGSVMRHLTKAGSGRPDRLSLARAGVAAAAVAGVVIFAAGCGSSGASNSPGASGASGASGSQPASSVYQEKLQYAQCMRSHGITTFPDPNSNGAIVITSKDNIDQSSPQYAAASSTCLKGLPGGGQAAASAVQAELSQGIKHSACMRAHGITNYPDPTLNNGQISMSLNSGNGPGDINTKTPQFQAAQKACQSLLPQPGGPAGAHATAPTNP
jgi:hypothetical protein